MTSKVFLFIAYRYETEPDAGKNAEKLPELIFYKTAKKNEVFPQFCTF
jgi:hypothetical protein